MKFSSISSLLRAINVFYRTVLPFVGSLFVWFWHQEGIPPAKIQNLL